MKLHMIPLLTALLCAAAPALASQFAIPDGPDEGFVLSGKSIGGIGRTGPSVVDTPVLAATFSPDANADGLLGGSDFAGFVSAWKVYDIRYDANGDGRIGGPDFAAFTRAFNARSADPGTSMPEPTAALLFGIGSGLVALGLRRRTREVRVAVR